MIVVTAGSAYIDIDAYAGMIAYAELLNLNGTPAIAASTAVLNESITRTLRNLDVSIKSDYVPSTDDTFVVIDLSGPDHFDRLVDVNRVVGVIDHHPGFEQYWQDKIGKGSTIEFIGAAATLVYEKWEQVGRQNEMSKASAELLAAAILDNTLNFGATITTDRDKRAFAFLSRHAGLDAEWTASYFNECQQSIMADLPKAITNDTKFLSFKGLPQELCLGQIVVWDANELIKSELNVIRETLGGMQEQWLANVIGISDGHSYFVSQSSEVKSWAETLLGVTFDGDVAIANRLWLRKEMLKIGQ